MGKDRMTTGKMDKEETTAPAKSQSFALEWGGLQNFMEDTQHVYGIALDTPKGLAQSPWYMHIDNIAANGFLD